MRLAAHHHRHRSQTAIITLKSIKYLHLFTFKNLVAANSNLIGQQRLQSTGSRAGSSIGIRSLLLRAQAIPDLRQAKERTFEHSAPFLKQRLRLPHSL
jgi:hypothetical protein